MSRYRCIVFDLDDTLLDTHGRLVPAAAREACFAMIQAGLRAGPAECVAERARYIHREPRGNVYRHLVATFGVETGRDPETVADAGSRAFHDRDVGPDLALFADARSLLERLSRVYRLYLVTAGTERTQRSKVEGLGIQGLFADVYYIDPSKGESKIEAFRDIAAREGGDPETFLSVGNRVDTDLGPAKRLGWRTCWVRVGEYKHLAPTETVETPDYEIPAIAELAGACRL